MRAVSKSHTASMSRLFSWVAPVLRPAEIFSKAVWGNVFSGRSARFAGYALAGLAFLFVVSTAEASSGRFFQQQVGDGKATSLHAEDAHDGVSQTARIAGRVPCVDGEAAGYPCKDMDLLAFVPIEEMEGFPCSYRQCFNDIWGWTDPVTGVEYALLARVDGVAFFDLSDPENPSFVGMLPATPGTSARSWRDIKVVNDHAVIVADFVGNHGMQVFDLSQLRGATDSPATFEPTALYDAFGSAHNVVVNDEADHVYIVGIQGHQETPQTPGMPEGLSCGQGPHIVDMSDPAQPTFAGCYNPSRGLGYTHDAQCVRYSGPDTRYAGKDICFTSDEKGGAITDVTDPALPEELGVFGYPNFQYTHQGWLTEDHRYLFANDELDEYNQAVSSTRTLIFDVQELDDPVFVGAWHGPTGAIDHNLYFHEGKLYEANYTAGLRVMDISYDGELSPDAIREVAYFDVHPESDEPEFKGSWSSYPWFESGIIAVSSMENGLYILAPSLSVVSVESEELPAEVMLLGNYPNPFNPETTISYALPQGSKVRLAVYDLLGHEVAVLVDGSQPAGQHTVRFDGGDLPSGSYVYRLQVGEEVVARTMTLVK